MLIFTFDILFLFEIYICIYILTYTYIYPEYETGGLREEVSRGGSC